MGYKLCAKGTDFCVSSSQELCTKRSFCVRVNISQNGSFLLSFKRSVSMRKRLSRRANRRIFKRSAKVHKQNRPKTMRGGFRL